MLNQDGDGNDDDAADGETRSKPLADHLAVNQNESPRQVSFREHGQFESSAKHPYPHGDSLDYT